MAKQIFTVSLSLTALLAASLATTAPAVARQSKPLGGLFSCEGSGKKQEGGALIGAAAGALIGSKVAKNEKTLGALVGAAAGAAAGSYIGCRMQSTDTALAQQATKRALETGQSQTWSNPRTGAAGRVDVNSSSYGPPINGSALRFERGVQTLASYDAVGGDYSARSTANLRASPSTKGAIVGKLSAGERVEVLGGVPGSTWVLVGRGGYGAGYVAGSLLSQSSYGPAPSCRMISASLSISGQRPTVERYNACRDDRGEWQLTAV
jgi:surface antigen